MRYEWDEAKSPAQPAASRRHLIQSSGPGLRGRTLSRSSGPHRSKDGRAALARPRRGSGWGGARAVLVVIHVYREDHEGEEVIRIISARAAEKTEVRRYQEQAMD